MCRGKNCSRPEQNHYSMQETNIDLLWSVFLSPKERMKNQKLQSLFPSALILPRLLTMTWGDLALNSILRKSAQNHQLGIRLHVCLRNPIIWECSHSRSWRQPQRVLAVPLWLERVDLAAYLKAWSVVQKILVRKSILLLNNLAEEVCRQGFSSWFSLLFIIVNWKMVYLYHQISITW